MSLLISVSKILPEIPALVFMQVQGATLPIDVVILLTRPTIRPGLAGTVPEFKVLSRSAERKSRFFMELASYASLLRQKFSY